MAYCTNFVGRFELNRQLTEAEYAYLLEFSYTNRIKRDCNIFNLIPDPIREAVGLPLGIDGEYFVSSVKNFVPPDGGRVMYYYCPPISQPGLFCYWFPSLDGKHLEVCNGNVAHYNEWLQYIIDNFLTRWDLNISGVVKFFGENDYDFGFIVAKNNKLKIVYSTIQNYLEDVQREAWIIEELLYALDKITEPVMHPFNGLLSH